VLVPERRAKAREARVSTTLKRGKRAAATSPASPEPEAPPT
jgi:hypothetical protein